MQLQQYDTYSACVEALKNGAIDAVTTDEVILAGYAAQSPGAFKVVGETFSEESYGIGLKKGDTELQTKINDAITKMEQDGAWKAALGQEPRPCRHRGAGAAAARQELSGAAADVETVHRVSRPDLRGVLDHDPVDGVLGRSERLILGTALAAMRLSPVPMLNWIGTSYVNVVRNTPLTLIILFCSFGLSQTLGITLVDPESLTSIEDSNFRLAVLGFTVYTAAFVCETVRVRGEHRATWVRPRRPGRWGLTFAQNLRIVLLPQAFRAVHHSAGLGADRVDEEHHDRVGDRRGRGRAADEGDDREHRGAGRRSAPIFMVGFVILTLPMELFFGWLGKADWRWRGRVSGVVGALRRPGPRARARNRCSTPSRRWSSRW